MKRFLSLVFLILVTISFTGNASANCGFGDHSGCGLHKTIIEGIVYYAESNETVGDAKVTITCYHNGESYTKTTTTLNRGKFKGSYLVLFPQDQCISGDDVLVSAVKKDMIGSGEGEVRDTIVNGLILNVDLAIINVPLVPELGVVVGILTVLGAVGIFFFVRKN